MSISPVQNKIASEITDPEARIRAQCDAQLAPLHKRRDGLVADLAALASSPAKHSMELLVQKHDPKALRNALAKVNAEIKEIEKISNSGKNLEVAKATPTKPSDEVTYTAPPPAPRAASPQKAVLQAPPTSINNIGAQIAAKQALRGAPPPFTAED
jgi:hypothetical protein